MPILSKIPEARRLLQTRGIIEPSTNQLRTETRKLWGDQRLQEAQQKIQDVKEKAQIGKGRNINIQPLDLIQQQAQQIMQNKFGLSGDYTQALGLGISRQLGRVPETVSAFPEFKGASFGAQMSAIEAERAGLTGTLGGIGRILRERQAEQEKIATEKQGELDKRRKDAIGKFLALREAIGKKGLPLSPEVGMKYLSEFQVTNDPEKLFNQYMTEAFDVPAVQRAFEKGGVTINIPSLFKELQYVGKMTPEQIEAAKKHQKTLKEIQGSGSISFEDL